MDDETNTSGAGNTDNSTVSTADRDQNNHIVDDTATNEQESRTEASSGASDMNSIMNTVSSYLNLIKPFSGDSNKEQSVECFFDTVEDLAAMAQWPPNIVHFVLLSKLTGKAAAFYEQNLKFFRGRPTKDIRLRFVKKFTAPVECDPWRSIINCKQAVGESVEDFANRLFDLREKCNSMGTDSFIGMGRLLALFLEGLANHIKEHMVTLNPRSFGEAVDIAQRIENRLSKLTSRRGTAMMTTAADYPDSDTEEITHSMSTMAVSKSYRNAADLNKTHATQGVKENKSIPFDKGFTKKGSRNSTKMKEKRDSKTINPKIEKSVFRDTSGTTMTQLNQIYGGTKHLVQIHAGREIIQSLIDPASDYSIISEATVDSMGMANKIYRGEKSSIAGALGGLIDSESCLDIIFKIDGKGDKYKHSFRVASGKQLLGYAIILGMDFLLPNRARIDYVTNTLYLWENAVAQLTPTSKVQSSANLLELAYKQDGDENSTPPILVQYSPDGSWRPLSEILNTTSNTRTSTLVCSGRPKNISYTVGRTANGDANISDRRKKQSIHCDDGYLLPIKQGTQAVGEDLVKLINLCRKHKGILQNNNGKLRILNNFSHSVELTDSTPIKRAQYQIPVALRKDLGSKLQEYINNDIIEPSSSPWNLPLIVKKKKNGELRLILDATAVNNVTRKIDYPIIRIEDTFNKLRNKKWFTNIDLKNGYHQIQLDAQSRKYYAFKTPFGKHQFKRMPMGASNSGLFFQKVMEKILSPLDPENLVIYQDDILIATNTVNEHILILDQLLTIFEDENVQINGDKSTFMAKEISFLGHTLRRGSFTPSSENLKAIELLRPPRTKKQLRGVLGKVNFYGRFVPALSQIALPLTNLLASKKREITWGPSEEEAFSKLKEALCTSPVLHYPDFGKKFIISIQVSDSAIVSALEQDLESGRWPIAYYSKKLNVPQRNYSVIEKHALAVITVLEYYHHLIHGYEVEVVTDRKAIEYLRCLRDGSTRTTNWINLAAKYSPNYTFDNNREALTQLLDVKDECREDDAESRNDIHEDISDNLDDKLARAATKSDLLKPESLKNIKAVPDVSDTLTEPIGTKIEKNHSTGLCPRAFTDGSCVKNGTPSATAGIGVCWENEFIPDFYGPCDGVLSNNKAELLAIIKAINLAKTAQLKKIIICTDSAYAISNITVNKAKWKSNGWINARGKSIENITYFQEIDRLEEEIDIGWEHVKGHSGHPENDKAHALALKGCEEAIRIAAKTKDTELVSTTNTQSMAIRAMPASISVEVTEEEIISQQETDLECKRIIDENRDTEMPTNWTPGIRCYADSAGCIKAKGIVEISPRQYKKINNIYVPSQSREKILTFLHMNKWTGHANFVNMCHTLLARYYWSTFRVDIRQHIDKCLDCQRQRSSRKKPMVLDFPKPKSPGEKIAVDIVGPIITSHNGDKYILTVIDMCSRYLTLCPLEDISTISVIQALEKNYISTFGTPTSMITDRGSNFRSRIFEESCKLMRIKHYLTAPYRPSTNGMVERANKEIKRKLTLLCSHAGDKWSDKLYLVQFSHNNAWHSSINTSPNKITFGRNMNFPGWELQNDLEIQDGDINGFITELRNRLDFIRTLSYEHEAQNRTKRNYSINKKRYLPDYKPGDLVMLRSIKRGKTRSEGFSFLYSGPYKIEKAISEVTFDIILPGNVPGQTDCVRAHAERLKPFVYATDMSIPCNNQETSENRYIDPVPPEATDIILSNKGSMPLVKEPSVPVTDETIPKAYAMEKIESINYPPTFEGRYFTRSKGKVNEQQLGNLDIKRGKIVPRDNKITGERNSEIRNDKER